MEEIARESHPVVVATSAKAKGAHPLCQLREEIKKSKRPHLILFGTGWGLCDEVIDGADVVLPPDNGRQKFNHLSVRGAAAIILDRLLGK